MHPLVYQFDQKPSSTQVVLGCSFLALCVYLTFLLNFQVSALVCLLETSLCLLPLQWGFLHEIAQSCTHRIYVVTAGASCHQW